ncbi:hypothetical protein IQ255_15885 [Pleurocapsales cyanobacterium LEGE 10410]|nr:hypothetical protein [Pleurocapsales cyanobacterium LEGE 10410]
MPTKNQQPQSTQQLNNLSNTKPPATPLQLHKYVWLLLGVFGLFVASFPVAYFRVAQSQEFQDLPLKSIDWAENQKDNLVYPDKK